MSDRQATVHRPNTQFCYPHTVSDYSQFYYTSLFVCMMFMLFLYCIYAGSMLKFVKETQGTSKEQPSTSTGIDHMICHYA